MSGKFYGIGVGPGDPELLTLKAKRLLEECDMIVAPKTGMEKQSVALEIAKSYIGEAKKIQELLFPMTYDEGELEKHWDAAGDEIAAMLENGKSVVFLTLGDPMVYSTYIYILKRIEEKGYDTTTVPGITSFCAAASRISKPLTEGNETMAVIPSAYECENLEEILTTFDNTVLMKISRNYDQMVDTLNRLGLLKSAVLISRCGMDDEKVEYDLEKLVGQKINYLSMILVKKGKVLGA